MSAIAIATLLSACGSDSDSTADSTADSTPGSTDVATSDAASDTTDASTVDDGTVDSGTADDGPTAETATRDDYVAAFATNYAIFDDDEQDQCIGETFVTAIGEDQLTSVGLAPGDIAEVVLLADLGLAIDQEALPAAVEDLASCGDLVTVIARFLHGDRGADGVRDRDHLERDSPPSSCSSRSAASNRAPNSSPPTKH